MPTTQNDINKEEGAREEVAVAVARGDQGGGTGRKSPSSKHRRRSQILTLIVRLSARNPDLGRENPSPRTECTAKNKTLSS